MKTDVTPLQHLMKGSHLGEDNSHTKTWCSDNIDYKIEHAMYKCLHLYPQPLHGWEIGGSPTCSFEILVAFVWNVEWHLFSMRIIYHSIFFINGSQRI